MRTATITTVVCMLVGSALVTTCRRSDAQVAATIVSGGNPDRGERAIQAYGCGACHIVPGMRDAAGQAGPSLEGIAGRTMLAGQLPNTPTEMVRWISAPQSVKPGTAMPNLGIDEKTARDIAAYLYAHR